MWVPSILQKKSKSLARNNTQGYRQDALNPIRGILPQSSHYLLAKRGFFASLVHEGEMNSKFVVCPVIVR